MVGYLTFNETAARLVNPCDLRLASPANIKFQESWILQGTSSTSYRDFQATSRIDPVQATRTPAIKTRPPVETKSVGPSENLRSSPAHIQQSPSSPAPKVSKPLATSGPKPPTEILPSEIQTRSTHKPATPPEYNTPPLEKTRAPSSKPYTSTAEPVFPSKDSRSTASKDLKNPTSSLGEYQSSTLPSGDATPRSGMSLSPLFLHFCSSFLVIGLLI